MLEGQRQPNPELFSGHALLDAVIKRTEQITSKIQSPSSLYAVATRIDNLTRIVGTLPEGSCAHIGQINAFPGVALAALNHAERGLNWRNEYGEDVPLNLEEAEDFVKQILSDPERAQVVGESLLKPHVVVFPRRALPLQYILPLLGREKLNLLDAGAALHLSHKMLNSDEFACENFSRRESLLNLWRGQVPHVDIANSLGVDMVDLNNDPEWVKSGYFRTSRRAERIHDLEVALKVAEGKKEGFPQMIADVIGLDENVFGGNFDAISAIFLIHQLPNPRAFFEKASRLLKQEGLLITIGEELMEGQTERDDGLWPVRVYQRQGNDDLNLISISFYLNSQQVTIGMTDIEEYKRLAQTLGFNFPA